MAEKSADKHIHDNGSQRRILDAIQLLAGHELHGLAPKDLVAALEVSPASITRDLHNLKEVGFAEQIQETGRWRLGPKVVQLSFAFSTELSRARQRLDEITLRYTRQP